VAFSATVLLLPLRQSAVARGCRTVCTFGEGWQRSKAVWLRPWRLNTVQFLLSFVK